MNRQLNAFVATLDGKTLAKVEAQCDKIVGTVNGAAEVFQTLGLTTRAEARPYVLAWAAKKYGAKLEEGQRGMKLPRDSAAEKAMQRVLNTLFPETVPQFGREQADPVAKLVKAFEKLTAGQKRSFKAKIGA